MGSTGFFHRLNPLMLLIISMIGIVCTYLGSFRLGVIDPQFAWTTNFDRTAAAATVGIAFASAGVLSTAVSSVRVHVVGFAVVTSASALLLIGNFLAWPMIITGVASLCIGAAVFLFTRYFFHLKSENLWVALTLGVAFLLSILNFLGAAAFGGLAGELVFWLQGNLLAVGGYSLYALLLGLILFSWMLAHRSNELAAILLFGVGLGIAGPLFFISCLIPIVVGSVINKSQEKSFLLACGILGALFVALADAVPRLLLGGYAPTLIIPIALIAIPILLCFNFRKV